MEFVILGRKYKEGEATEHILTREEIKEMNEKKIIVKVKPLKSEV